jgi:diaminohydroxyphosphoribosylaminopyrimidine deaminase/5-amino-6-(5-phosphoribosylamino)uracil reductase
LGCLRLQVFWECGGTLAAPAIAGGIIHKLMAFVAPKIIGGTRAPTPVGDLGNVEMTQAVNLVDPRWEQVGVGVFEGSFSNITPVTSHLWLAYLTAHQPAALLAPLADS